MNGAREYADLFGTGQRGRLYLVSSSHARGRTFRIFVLPAGEVAIPNGPPNAPLNKDAVEVFGVVGGQRGWDESYGWLHRGPWEADFAALVDAAKRAKVEAESAKMIADAARDAEERNRREALLATYQPASI